MGSFLCSLHYFPYIPYQLNGQISGFNNESRKFWKGPVKIRVKVDIQKKSPKKASILTNAKSYKNVTAGTKKSAQA